MAHAQTKEITPSSSDFFQLEIIDSFVEIHTGPGRGYPIFYVVEQGELVDILTKRAGWYEIRTKSGRVGWATTSQLSRTLQTTGEPADLPSVGFGDYVKNKWRVGFTAGTFSDGDLEGSDQFSSALSYRFFSWFSLEVELGKFFDSDIEGDFYSTNLLIEPLSKWRYSPELIFGMGEISRDGQPKEVSLSIDSSDYNSYGLGLNYYLGRNFVIRGEYRQFDISGDDGDTQVDSWRIGFNTFF